MNQLMYGEPLIKEEIKRYGSVIPGYYGYMDKIIGEVVKLKDDSTTIFIVSDHGFGPRPDEGGFNYDFNFVLEKLGLVRYKDSANKEIDYDALKKRGFLRQKQDGQFLLRTRTSSGNYSAEQIAVLLDISKKFGKGIFHTTTRQGIEIPYIAFENIEKVEEIVKDAGVDIGTSGPRLRSTTTCPGNNWCKSGLVNTFGLFDRIEKELGIRCGRDLPLCRPSPRRGSAGSPSRSSPA